MDSLFYLHVVEPCYVLNLRTVLMAEAIVRLQKQKAKYTKKPLIYVNVIKGFSFMVL